ncbi:MAG: CHASE2 domain-containing protein, partial [Bryobacteraceae bacterium]|nr:CHASE2 domain-containing protein [Bryobacteraceae bacterium]
MTRRQRRFTPGYLAVLGVSFALAVAAGWLPLASRMDRDAYDAMSRVQPVSVRSSEAVVLAFDERTLSSTGGMRNLRDTLARVLAIVVTGKPSVIAIDIILSESGSAKEDRDLAAVFRQSQNLVLASDLVPETQTWEDPIPEFRAAARAIGHVHAAPDPVSRVLPLELVGNNTRRWAMALEAARLHRNVPLTESPGDLDLGGTILPVTRDSLRGLFIRYREGIPSLSVANLLQDPSLATQLRGKTVFVGVTAQTAARDRLMTPLDRMMSGVEIHAQAFETILNRDFLRPATLTITVAICLLLVSCAALIFAFLTGWQAYAASVLLLVGAHAAPHFLFRNGIVLSYLATVLAAWFSAVSAAAWQYFVVRRQLQRSESDKHRYQQAIHFVTHEMRSPLTAIQGSSELMGRYNLTEEKRRQMADMINSESRRLAKMIQTFLDIERLTDGQIEIKSEPFELYQVLRACVDRVQSLAERKEITILIEAPREAWVLRGDRELMEYAVYNLLTNAIKYSPAATTVSVETIGSGNEVRVKVIDQGIGMDEKELRHVGQKFYRTRRAEA